MDLKNCSYKQRSCHVRIFSIKKTNGLENGLFRASQSNGINTKFVKSGFGFLN